MNIINSIKYRIHKFLNQYNDIEKGLSFDSNNVIFKSTLLNDVKIGYHNKIDSSIIQGKITLSDNNLVEHSKLSGNITIRNNCKLHFCQLQGNIQLGKFTSLWGPNLDIHTGEQKVRIGSFCSIARNVSMQAFNHNHRKITTYFMGKNLFKEHWDNEHISNGDIEIGNDVWIGAQCVILGGITIGHGAVVAANSMVNKNIPPYAIVGGTPAKVIGYRFSEDIIQQLLDLKWWEWNDEKIQKNKFLFENELTLEMLERMN